MKYRLTWYYRDEDEQIYPDYREFDSIENATQYAVNLMKYRDPIKEPELHLLQPIALYMPGIEAQVKKIREEDEAKKLELQRSYREIMQKNQKEQDLRELARLKKLYEK